MLCQACLQVLYTVMQMSTAVCLQSEILAWKVANFQSQAAQANKAQVNTDFWLQATGCSLSHQHIRNPTWVCSAKKRCCAGPRAARLCARVLAERPKGF